MQDNREKEGAEKESKEINKGSFIIFKNVSFSFNSQTPVLKNIGLEIPDNSIVALVGETGVGKTTIVNLLLGLLKPDEGKILVGGTTLKEFGYEKFRRNVGYVTQEDVIFNDTVYNNITLFDRGSRDRKLEKVRNAAKRARIDHFIMSQENQYDTLLGESGINISGGQRQRISIARELYKEPNIIIFDEATSSLDSATENQIRKNIEMLRGEKTIILIAHRLSTVRNVDRIFVLKDGTIVEEGTYDDLFERRGEFRRMVDRQEEEIEDPETQS
jgi:subfamily B ATP-binding cassette protein MsbA